MVLHGEGRSFCSGLDFPRFIAEGPPVDDMLFRRDGAEANLAQRVAYGFACSRLYARLDVTPNDADTMPGWQTATAC